MTIPSQSVAGLIRAEISPCRDHPMPFPKPSCWTCGRNGAFERAARIVENERRRPRICNNADQHIPLCDCGNVRANENSAAVDNPRSSLSALGGSTPSPHRT